MNTENTTEAKKAEKAWYVETPYGESGRYISDSKTTALIAKVYNKEYANLLASAPKLLAACQEMMGFLNELKSAVDMHPDRVAMRQRAEEAIAEATKKG